MYAENKNFVQETINFEFAIATANRLHPKFVVICGDLINETGNAAQAAEFARIAAKLDPAIKLYNVAGNHDVENQPTPATLAAYREKFGPGKGHCRYGPVLALALQALGCGSRSMEGSHAIGFRPRSPG